MVVQCIAIVDTFFHVLCVDVVVVADLALQIVQFCSTVVKREKKVMLA